MRIREYFTKQHILSITMIVICAVYLTYYPDFKNLGIWGYMNLFGTTVALIDAAIVTLMPRADIHFSAGLIAAGLGMMIFCKLTVGLTSTSLGYIALGAIGSTLGLLCIILSFPVYCGSKYDTKRISTILSIYCVLLVILVLANTIFDEGDLFQQLDRYKLELMTIIPSLMYIWMLSNTEISYRGLAARAKDNLDSIAKVTLYDRNAYIHRDYLLDRKDRWYTVGSGYIEKEQCINLHLDNKKTKMIIEKWYDGTYWCMLIDDNKGTMIQTYRFQITNVVPNGKEDVCDRVTIYGTDGFFIRLIVKDSTFEPELSTSERIHKFILGY